MRMRTEALVVNHRRRGPTQMTGMGDVSSVLNTLTGGEYGDVKNELDTVKTLLKVSIAASIVSGAFALVALARGN